MERVYTMGAILGVLHPGARTPAILKQYIEDREFAFYLEKTEKTLPFDEFLYTGPRFQGLILL
jgi:hypothetical protein